MTKPAPRTFEEFEAQLQPATPEQVLFSLKKQGPYKELDYLDAKNGRLEDLSFDEWKRREELIDGMGFLDRVSRNWEGVGDAVGGLLGVVAGTAGEIKEGWKDRLSGEMGAGEAVSRFGSTVAEAALLGAVDFTQLVQAVDRNVGWLGLENIGKSKEEVEKGDYAQYQERQEARRYRAQLARDSALGSAVGGVMVGAEGNVDRATDVQQTIADTRMANASELGAMVSPTNPLNVLPIGAGAKAGTMGRLAGRGTAFAAEKVAAASRAVERATQIGNIIESSAAAANPAVSASTKVALGKRAAGLALASGVASGYATYNATDGNILLAVAAGMGGREMFARAARRASNVAGSTARAADFFAAAGRAAAEGPRLQSTLARVARDPSVPKWAAERARFWEQMGATQAVRTAKGAAGGAAVGAGVSGGLALAAGEEERDVVGATVAGALTGAPLGAAGDIVARMMGADRAVRLETERMLLGEAQRANGGDAAAKLFYSLPESEQLAMGTIQAIAGPMIPIEVVTAAQFAERGGTTGAGVFLPPAGRTDRMGTILINAEATRDAGATALHEFAHALTARKHPGEIRAYVEAMADPEQLAAFEADYLKRYIGDRKRSGEWPAEQPIAEDAPPAVAGFDEFGFPRQDVSGEQAKVEAKQAREAAAAADVARAREELTRDNGREWLYQEFFAEKGAEALGALGNEGLAKLAETGEWEPAAAQSLRVKRAVLEEAGVPFDADGKPSDPDVAKVLAERGEKSLGGLLGAYTKELADYAPRLAEQVKKNRDTEAAKGPALDLGENNQGMVTHPVFKKSFETKPDGSKENDLARVTKDGQVQIKTGAEIKSAMARRADVLAKLFPRKGRRPVTRDDQSPLVELRMRDDGGQEISGTQMPQGFWDSPAFSDALKQRMRVLQDHMQPTWAKPREPGAPVEAGESINLWYHQIGSGGNPAAWAAALRKGKGNVRATFRELRPISFLYSGADNMLVRALDLVALNDKALKWAHGEQLPLWGGNLDAFHADLKTLFANWANGVEGHAGIGSTKHQFFVGTELEPGGFLGKDTEKNSLIKSFRVDRMEDVRPSGRTGFTFDYTKFKNRLSPDGAQKEGANPGDGGRISKDGNRPKKTEGESLADAKAFVEGGMGRSRPTLPGERKARRDAERDQVVEWAKQAGRIFDENPLSRIGERSVRHGEHDVAYNERDGRWWKVTHSGRAGVTAEFDYDMLPPFDVKRVYSIEAMPQQYLERMSLLNEEFGGTVDFEGVFIEDGEPRMVVSQADVSGKPATRQQMVDFMKASGYVAVPGISIGKEGTLSFVHPEKNVALFDGHEGNFRIDADGDVHVIDAITVRLEPEETQFLLRQP